MIKNRKYVANKKNKGNVPKVRDKRVLLVPVGCGRCVECRKMKMREWKVRLMEEIRNRQDGYFVTLSFSEESLIKIQKKIKGLKGYELENETATKATRLFLERWRKKHKKSVRHWLVTELGQKNTERIHIHGIIWTDKPEEIQEKWKYGNVWIGDYVNEKTVNYIVKYISKPDIKHKEYKSKILTSPGIGNGYTKRPQSKNNKYNGTCTREYYRTRQGIKLALPIYYRNAIYTEDERELLWLQKLDQEKRYVLGREIDISKTEKGYYNQLETAREYNKRLGYGDNEINWQRRRYENNRRNLIKWKRVRLRREPKKDKF